MLEKPLWMSAGLFVKIFAGSARLTAAFRAHPPFEEKVAKPCDILYGENFDLLVESNLRNL